MKHRLPKPLTKPQMERLLKSPTTIRNHTIIEVLYSTGLRVSELCSLQWTDIDMDRGMVRVRNGKGGKDRITLFSTTMLNQLTVYHESLNGQCVGRVFPITRKTVWEAVSNCGRMVGLSHVTPHTLRHTFATHLLNGGANTRDIQELLGHSRLETTQIYTHVAMDRMRKVHKGCHPRG